MNQLEFVNYFHFIFALILQRRIFITLNIHGNYERINNFKNGTAKCYQQLVDSSIYSIDSLWIVTNEKSLNYCIHKFEYVAWTMSNLENIFYKIHKKIHGNTHAFDDSSNFSSMNSCGRKNMETFSLRPLLYFSYWVVSLRKSRILVSATNLQIIFKF